MQLTPEIRLTDEQSRVIATLIREELARRRISRQLLADQAKISISTLEKALSGRRPFTLATTIRLEQALGDLPHSLVDVSHRQVGLVIAGPHAATVLAAGCPLDLDRSAFPLGMCTRTVLAKAEIVLWRIADDGFHLEVWRSFAAYVSGLIAEAARELAVAD